MAVGKYVWRWLKSMQDVVVLPDFMKERHGISLITLKGESAGGHKTGNYSPPLIETTVEYVSRSCYDRILRSPSAPLGEVEMSHSRCDFTLVYLQGPLRFQGRIVCHSSIRAEQTLASI